MNILLKIAWRCDDGRVVKFYFSWVAQFNFALTCSVQEPAKYLSDRYLRLSDGAPMSSISAAYKDLKTDLLFAETTGQPHFVDSITWVVVLMPDDFVCWWNNGTFLDWGPCDVPMLSLDRNLFVTVAHRWCLLSYRLNHWHRRRHIYDLIDSIASFTSTSPFSTPSNLLLQQDYETRLVMKRSGTAT